VADLCCPLTTPRQCWFVQETYRPCQRLCGQKGFRASCSRARVLGNSFLACCFGRIGRADDSGVLELAPRVVLQSEPVIDLAVCVYPGLLELSKADAAIAQLSSTHGYRTTNRPVTVGNGGSVPLLVEGDRSAYGCLSACAHALFGHPTIPHESRDHPVNTDPGTARRAGSRAGLSAPI